MSLNLRGVLIDPRADTAFGLPGEHFLHIVRMTHTCMNETCELKRRPAQTAPISHAAYGHAAPSFGVPRDSFGSV